MKCTWFMICCAVGVAYCIEHDFKGFDDSILFSLNWPGVQDTLDNLVDEEAKKPKIREILEVTTTNKEDYECHLPELKENESISIDEYEGPSPVNLLKPLFLQKICSYRLESYWSYEVCHGRYIRQYHDERDGKQVKTQEFYLGHWSIEKQMKLEAESNAAQEAKKTPHTTKVDGQSLAYVEMVMDDGTVCDLNGKPRLTRVLYVCYSHGKHEIYSFKESATCEYEIIILSPLLCEHPQFKPKEVSENIIDCIPMGDAPKKPRSLLKMEVDSLRFHHQTIRLMNNEKDKGVLAVFKVEKIDEDGKTHLKFELQPLGEGFDMIEDKTAKPEPVTSPLTDNSPVRAFLNGENCLNGGTGWWKYEFCYGHHVSQFHVERGGDKTTLLLGTWNQQNHLDWIAENKNKAPKPLGQRTSISHFYSDGDICDKTGNQRQTEVKLKCLENASSSSQVSLYLLEPRTCHYILGVESPLICEILPLADENGLIKTPLPILKKQEAVDETSDDKEESDKNKVVDKVGND